MQLKDYCSELYEYNYWANKRYLAVAETLTEEQLFRKQGHSWDSVHAVLGAYDEFRTNVAPALAR